MKNKFISLEASAGSGKTHNLTKRFITLLLDFDTNLKEAVPLQNILALTFTNKATVEMKERIVESLKKIALNYDVKDLTSSLNLPKEKISQNAVTAINSLIQNYDKFNVRTTDSFINLIIKACALKLGISPNYEIKNTYDEYIDYAIDFFLNELFVNKNVEELLNYFFEQFLVDSANSWNIKGFISNKFKEFYGKEISKQKIDYGSRKEYVKVLKILSSDFNKICSRMLDIKEFSGVDLRFKKSLDKIKDNDNYLFSSANISTYFQKESLPYKKNVPDNETLNALFDEAKKIMKNFFEYRAFGYYDTYLQIFGHIIDEFDNRSRKDSVIFLQDINRKISNIFQSSLLPEIYYRLSNNFKDFLVDEFQDTNKIQWETLKLIVEENLSQNGSFFYVGDKKQAIYGFRGSDFQIFDLPLAEFSNYNPAKLALKTNYRSCENIVKFNNTVFSSQNVENLIDYIINTKQIRNAAKYRKELAEVFETSEQQVCEDKKNAGYVEISCYEYAKEDKDNIDDKVKEYVYKKIETLKERFNYEDITILCRQNNEVEKIGKWLLEKNINIESFKTLNIKNFNIVKELFSILQFLNMPVDDTAFTSFITGEIFLKETKLDKRDILKFLYEYSFTGKTKNVLYVKFREKYPQIWQEYIEEFFKSAGFIAVYELTVAVISKFKVFDNFKNDGNVILRFLELVNDFESKKQDLQNFMDYFTDDKNKDNEKFFIKVPSENAVKIMSIHKAKGLQFNVVIMPYFYIGQISAESPFLVENKDKISFVKIEQPLTNYSEKLNDIYYKKYFKSLSDELNILYVASTRAVYEFYGLITEAKESKEDKKSLINIFIDEKNRILGQIQKYKTADKKQKSDIKIIPAQLDDITQLICDSAVEIYGSKNKDMLLKGQIIHYALSMIESFDNKTLNEQIDNAVTMTKAAYPNEDTGGLKRTLTEVLSQKDIAELFNKNNKIFNEKEFVDKYGNTIRIDKLIIKENEIIIADYKSSIYDIDYITKQLTNYQSVIQEIYPSQKIQCCIVDIENKKLLK